jgi:hypothetical protein
MSNMPRGAVGRALRSYYRHRRAARVGLSRCHTSPRYWAEYTPDAQYLAVRSIGVRQCIPPTQQRGLVNGFSPGSRRRMLKRFAQIDRDYLGQSLLVTLTYPRTFPTESSTYKRHLDTFSKRLQRTFPRSSAIWKLEYQERGAPHFHLIVMGVPFMARAWLSRAWYEIVRSNDERHLRAGTQVQRCNSARKACAYASKYVAKISVGTPVGHSGRFWGVVGRQNLAKNLCQWQLDRRGFTRLSRVIRNLAASRRKSTAKRRFTAQWIYCDGRRGIELVAWAAGLDPVAPLTLPARAGGSNGERASKSLG